MPPIQRQGSGKDVRMGILLLVVLVLLVMGAMPTWRHSRRWGYGPSGGLGVVLVILFVMVLLGYIPRGF